VLKTLKMLGLDNKEPIDVKGVKVAPRDVVAVCLPDPAHLGDRMFGKTCAGTWVKGVLGPEASDPDSFLASMPKYDFPNGMKEM